MNVTTNEPIAADHVAEELAKHEALGLTPPAEKPAAKRTAKKPAATKKPAADKPAPGPKPEITRGMIGKCARALKKAGNTTPSDEEVTALAKKLLKAGVPIMDTTSSKIAKFLRGEIKMEELKA